jgi:hypothetical protein
MKWNSGWRRPMQPGGGKGSPLFTLDEARIRLETEHLPRSNQRRPEDFPKPADKLYYSGADRRPKFRLDELQAWLKEKGYPFVAYKIEKGIPLPPRVAAREENLELIAAVRKMDVNDSFEFEEEKLTVVRHAMEPCARYATRRTEGGKRRIWRLE